MKHINYFSPNVKPTSEYAQRQWKWNFLRKLGKKFIAKGADVKKTRQDFVTAAIGMNMFEKAIKARREYQADEFNP